MSPAVLHPSLQVPGPNVASPSVSPELPQCAPAPTGAGFHEQRVALRGISWEQYGQLLAALEGQRRVYVNYDRGALEIMVISSRHEAWKRWLAKLIDTLVFVLRIDAAGRGNFTFRSEAAERGLEPDECWYIANEAKVRGRVDLNLDVDPPPDLVLEVEVSRSLISRLEILAGLRVPEVWRFDGEALTALRLTDDGKYLATDHSLGFPWLRVADLIPWLKHFESASETLVLHEFSDWVQQQLPRTATS